MEFGVLKEDIYIQKGKKIQNEQHFNHQHVSL